MVEADTEWSFNDSNELEALEQPYFRVDRAWLIRALTRAFFEARKGKLKTADENAFEVRYIENIELLADDIMYRRYKPSRGIAFIVTRPVVREIFAAPFRDRVVHHFLHNMCANWWDKRFIYNSSSCRKGKGTHFGIGRLEHDIRSVSNNYRKETYIIKMDIQGYFMSLPRERLYYIICWGLKRQFPKRGVHYRLLKYLWREIIMDDPVKGVKIRPPVRLWDLLPDSKSLFYQPKGKGIVIGNLSSQLLSNIYLSQLDRFVTMDLGYKHYGRYVDDFYLVVPAEKKDIALNDVKVIERYLQNIGLKMHPKKTHVQEVKKGVPFLGAVVYPFFRVPGRRFKDNFYQAARKFESGVSGSTESIASYLGYCSKLRGEKLCQKVFESVGWDYPKQ